MAELTSAEALLESLRKKKAKFEERTRAERDNLDSMIANVEDVVKRLAGPLAETREPARPARTRSNHRKATNGDAIKAGIEAEPQGLPALDLLEVLKAENHRLTRTANPAKVLSNELNDLRRKGEVYKDDEGRWRLGAGPPNPNQ